MLRELNNCLDALQKIDMEVLVVDTMHPGLRIPAVYTIIPGAHFRERAAGGDAVLFAAKLAAELLDPAELEEKLSSMQEKLPDAYYLEFYRGRNLYEQGVVEPALNCFRQALEKNPDKEDMPYICSYTGSCLRDLGRFREAITVLDTGLAVDEERPDIHNILGVCHFKCDNFERAIHHFQRAVELNPASAIDYANIASNYRDMGKKELAIQFYQLALDLDPSIEFARDSLHSLQE